MFTSVRRCTGDLTCEVLILTCFGKLPPDRQLYLGMGTMIVKETIRGRQNVSAWEEGETYRRIGVGAYRRLDLQMVSERLHLRRHADTPLRRPVDPPYADPVPRPPEIFGW